MFEFDPAKSEANLAKHGIDFETAQELWLDDRALEIETRFQPEERKLLIGKIAGKHWTAVFTWRENRLRIISARRSLVIEAKAYDRQND